MTTPVSGFDLLIDLPAFWTTSSWDADHAVLVTQVLQASAPGATIASLPALSASSAVPVEDADGKVENIVFTFFGLWFAPAEIAAERADRRRRRQTIELVDGIDFEVEEFSFSGPPSSDGHVPLLLFSTPNIDLADTLGEAFASIAATARWADAS